MANNFLIDFSIDTLLTASIWLLLFFWLKKVIDIPACNIYTLILFNKSFNF